MNKKYYVVYFSNDKIITNLAEDWANENMSYFPNGKPSQLEICLFLIDNFGFTLVSDKEKHVCYKLTGTIDFIEKNQFIEIYNCVDIGYNNYEINFRIGQNNYFLSHTPNPNTVTLLINNIPTNPVRPELDIIAIELLDLGDDWIYDNNGIHKTTHSEARQLFLYLKVLMINN